MQLVPQFDPKTHRRTHLEDLVVDKTEIILYSEYGGDGELQTSEKTI